VTPRWPAIIRYHGEAEVTFVSDQTEWDVDADLSCWPYGPKDEFIDSDGRVFALSYTGRPGGPGLVNLEATERLVEARDIVRYVREHLLAVALPTQEYDRRCESVPPTDLAARSIAYLGDTGQ
jgi:hypothetical protein